MTTCGTVEHTDRCAPYCADRDGSGCNVGRKHSTIGGVCCISCCMSCSKCGGTFYNEEIRDGGTGIDAEDGEEIDLFLCHCCASR